MTDPFVRVVFEDRRGVLWVGTDVGLFRKEGDTLQRVDDRDGIPRMGVHTIWEDRQGRLLVGGIGLLVFEGDRLAYYRSNESLADNSIRTIRESRDGAVWIGTISGLRRLPHGIQGDPFVEPRVVDSTNISVLSESRSGQMWIGTYGRGLMRFDNGRFSTLSASSSLPHNNVLAIFEDSEENVWVGTQGGMLRLQPAAASTITPNDGTPLSINTIYQDPNGPLLVAALDGRLFQVVRQTLVPYALPDALGALVIRNVFRDSRGRLWIGTDGQGIARIDGHAVVRLAMTQGLVVDFIRAFCEDRDGSIWIGTDGGLSRWHEGSFINFTSATGLIYGSIRALLVDHAGVLWVATEHGLTRFRSGRFERDPLLEQLDGMKVWALHEDAEHGLWIGTHGAGLFLLKAGQLRQFTTTHGLPSNKIHFVGEDRRGNLWMSGPTGVVSIARRDLEQLESRGGPPVPARLYDTTDGLMTNQMRGGVQPAGVITASGEVWLPSTKGAVMINPDVPERRVQLPLVVEQAIADGRVVMAPAALDVPPGEGKIEIQYTSIQLGAPERLRFKYWMEGLEREWTIAGGRRVAYYTNVPPGRYRFHVAAYEIHAPQHATERVIDVRVRPYVYQTGWFLGVCGLMLAGAIWGGYRLHLRNLRRQFDAVLEERNRLAREMHDTLIQGCVGVSTLLEAASQAHEVSPQLGSHLLERARAEVRAAVDEARMAVWNLRNASPRCDHLVPAVSQLAHRLGIDAGREVRFDITGTPIPLGADRERGVMLLIREAVQNAIRHAAPDHITVSLRFEPGALEVDIEDDGAGFDWSAEQRQAAHHYGLVGMRERVERMSGTFTLTTSPGNGTRVHFRIPVPRSRRHVT